MVERASERRSVVKNASHAALRRALLTIHARGRGARLESGGDELERLRAAGGGVARLGLVGPGDGREHDLVDAVLRRERTHLFGDGLSRADEPPRAGCFDDLVGRGIRLGGERLFDGLERDERCLLYTSPSPRD